jgi:hypothetical protein
MSEESTTDRRDSSAKLDDGDHAPELWLHCRVKRTCWVVKALYEYEAFVTRTPNADGSRFAVDQIRLSISRDVDSASYTHSSNSTDYCGKSDEVWKTGVACGRTSCIAGATYEGRMWGCPPVSVD